MANAGFNDETTINANLTGTSTLNASLGSNNQTNVELPPINYIPGYKVAEEERRVNEEERISNENAREEYINELKEEVASGAFDGKDGQDGRDGAIQYTAGTGIEITDENVINNTQTSAEWGNISGDIDDQTDLVTVLSGKANTSDIPTKVSDLTNDSGFIDSTVNNLTNYYTKSQTYTKNEIDSLIAQIPGFNVIVVQTLPVSDIDPHTIYLVPKEGSASDIYDEYIYINNTWELIGNTQADLTNYYTKSEADTLLGNKQNTLVSGTNIKTVNNNTLLGSGDITISAFDTLPIGTEVDYDGNTVPTGWTQINTLVWENDSPENTFAGQNIILNDTYDRVDIIYERATDNTDRHIVITLYNENVYNIAMTLVNNKLAYRAVKLNGNTLSFGSTQYIATYGSGPTQDNTKIVPIKVVGYK